jgi:hypothetical protein
MNVRKTAPRSRSSRPGYYDGSYQIPDFVAPGDVATIYDINALYTSGIDGTGQKLAIVGQTDVYLADLNAFRTGFGLTPISGCTTNSSGVITACNSSNFVYVLDGTDPGVATPAEGDVTEADLDLEWSAATARGAQIIFVNSTDVFTSYYYAIDNKLAPVISMSYGNCEFDDNELPADEVELTKSNSFGITFMNSSGDSGAAACDPPPPPATDPDNLAIGGLAVSYPASSPEVTAVGGTAINYPNGFTSTYWGTGSGSSTNGGTAQNPPLPETSWNDDVELGLAFNLGTPMSVQESFGIISGGGGASNCSVQTSDFSNCVSGFPQPSWQTVTVPGQASARFSPDVALMASPNFPGYVYCTPVEELSSTSPYDTETTSTCGTGTSSDIAAAVNGICSGACNGNNTLVGPSIVGGTSASTPIFAGIVTLLNQYLSSNGLGNINPTLYTLAKTTSNGAFHQVTSGTNVVYCEGGQPPSPWPTALQCPSEGFFGYDASNADTSTGYNLVTGLGSVDANNLFLVWSGTSSGDFALAPGTLPPSLSTPAGQPVTTTLTVTLTSGASATVNFRNNMVSPTGTSSGSCTGLPTGVGCTFTNPNNPSSPTSFTLTTANPTATVDLTITTQANLAASGPAAITITPTGSTQTANVNLTVTVTNQTFTIGSANATYPVNAGGTAPPVEITVTGTNGFIVGSGTTATTALPLTYTCTQSSLPSEASCSFSPSGGNSVSATAITLNISTAAPTGQLRPPLGRGSNIFYALLLPGLFGIVFAAGSRTRTARLLSLIVVLGFSTLWLGACGGSSNSSQKNPGTPAGTYSVIVNATTGGAVPLTSQFTVTLTVTN